MQLTTTTDRRQAPSGNPDPDREGDSDNPGQAGAPTTAQANDNCGEDHTPIVNQSRERHCGSQPPAPAALSLDEQEQGVGTKSIPTRFLAPGETQSLPCIPRRDEETKSPITESESQDPGNDGIYPPKKPPSAFQSRGAPTSLLSNLPLTTAKFDASTSHYGCSGAGNMARLSTPDSASAESRVSAGRTKTKKSDFGSKTSKRRQPLKDSSLSHTDTTQTDAPMDLEQGQVGGVAVPGFSSRQRDTIAAPDDRAESGSSDSMCDESHLRRRHEEIDELERNLLKEQCLFFIAFSIFLCGGLGLSVGVHIHRTSS
jgi:hypothetical protein